MASLSAGDRVEIQSREVTSEDEKSGLYYSYFGGLTGSVDRIYDDGSVCVEVDLESLTQAARERHLSLQENERKRWLDGLSGEARNRLSAEQKQLKLSYKILVGKNDVIQVKGGKPSGGKGSSKSGAASSDSAPSGSKGPARAPEPGPADAEPVSKRASEDDLAKAEEEYLRSLQERTQ